MTRHQVENFMKSNGLNHSETKTLLEDSEVEHGDTLFCSSSLAPSLGATLRYCFISYKEINEVLL